MLDETETGDEFLNQLLDQQPLLRSAQITHTVEPNAPTLYQVPTTDIDFSEDNRVGMQYLDLDDETEQSGILGSEANICESVDKPNLSPSSNSSIASTTRCSIMAITNQTGSLWPNPTLHSNMEPMDHSTTRQPASGPQSSKTATCLPSTCTSQSDPLPIILEPTLMEEEMLDYDELPTPAPYAPITTPISPVQHAIPLLEDGEIREPTTEVPPPPPTAKEQPRTPKIHKADIRDTRYTSHHLSKDGRFRLLSALSQHNQCGMCTYKGSRKGVKRHAPMHVGRYYCSCGFNSLNRDHITAHHRRWQGTAGHGPTIHIVDRASFPRFCQKVGLTTNTAYAVGTIDSRLDNMRVTARYAGRDEPHCIRRMQQPAPADIIIPRRIATHSPSRGLTITTSTARQPRVALTRNPNLDRLAKDLSYLTDTMQQIYDQLENMHNALRRCTVYTNNLSRQFN